MSRDGERGNAKVIAGGEISAKKPRISSVVCSNAMCISWSFPERGAGRSGAPA